jgi:hypothetical protein
VASAILENRNHTQGTALFSGLKMEVLYSEYHCWLFQIQVRKGLCKCALPIVEMSRKLGDSWKDISYTEDLIVFYELFSKYFFRPINIQSANVETCGETHVGLRVK